MYLNFKESKLFYYFYFYKLFNSIFCFENVVLYVGVLVGVEFKGQFYIPRFTFMPYVYFIFKSLLIK